jgi:hypothetical protein
MPDVGTRHIALALSAYVSIRQHTSAYVVSWAVAFATVSPIWHAAPQVSAHVLLYWLFMYFCTSKATCLGPSLCNSESRLARCASGVSLCTFVLVKASKASNRGLGRTNSELIICYSLCTFVLVQFMYFCTSKSK